jgi:hypothetical protein
LATIFGSYSSRTRRILVIGLFFILGVAVTCVGAVQTLSQQDANSINNDLNDLRKNITLQGIFGNNLFICLLMFVPVVGWIFGFAALYNTGVVIAAQSMAPDAGGAPPLLILFSLFIFPFTWLEFISYSIGLSEGFWLMLRAVQSISNIGVSFRRELGNLSKLITIVTLMLLAGAAIEYWLITLTGT